MPRASHGVAGRALRSRVAGGLRSSLVLASLAAPTLCLGGRALAAQPRPPAAASADPPLAAERGVETLTLEEAVSRALGHNPTARVAAQEIARADALVTEVRSNALPTLTGSLAYTRLDGPRVVNGNVLLAADELAGNLTLSVPLVAPKAWVAWSHAKDDLQTARWNAADVKRQLAVATARAYLSLVAQHRVIEVNERAVATARAHYDFAHRQFTGGWGTRLDEVRAEQELQSDVTQVEVARAQLARLREALGVLAGADHPLDATEVVALPPAPTADEAAQAIASRRADLRALEQRVSSTKRVVRDKWADYAPQLVGIFQPFFQTPPTQTVPLTGYQAQLALVLPFYDGGLRYGQQRERQALAEEALAQLEGTRRQALADVRASEEALARASDGLVAAREAARLSHDALSLTQLAYQHGASTNIEVIDAERRARDADTGVAIAEDASRQALLDLLTASGRFPGPV